MHDIYDPPPVPVPQAPPGPGPVAWTIGDLIGLVLLFAGLFTVSVLYWDREPTMALLTALGGALVVLESWFTALGFLHRRPSPSLSGRWMIFLAALVPWLVGLGVAAMMMLGLFRAADWVS